MTIRVVLIDGDAVFRDHVGVQLTRAGDFSVTALENGRTVAARDHDAAVLDAGLAAPSAEALCAGWRAAGEALPVLVLTPADDPAAATAARTPAPMEWLAKPLRLKIFWPACGRWRAAAAPAWPWGDCISGPAPKN